MTTSLPPTNQPPRSLQGIAEKLLGVRGVALEQVTGGRDGRVYRLTAPAGAYAFKTYFRHASDSRVRMETEFGGLTFLWQNGERSIPRPLMADPETSCAVYEWIDGERVLAGAVTADAIHDATSFLARLHAYKHRPGNNGLGLTSEACFSGPALLDGLQRGVQPLLACAGRADLAVFLKQELLPAIETVSAWSRSRLGESFDAELPLASRTLSPSDFGFHNALRLTDGEMVFLDLEHFGWDDPAKTICDFLLHPGMTVPPALKQLFATSMLREFPAFAARVEAFYPLFGLKWCLILLNEFLPARLSRRQHGSQARQSEQLSKARNMLAGILAEYRRFPYGG